MKTLPRYCAHLAPFVVGVACTSGSPSTDSGAGATASADGTPSGEGSEAVSTGQAGAPGKTPSASGNGGTSASSGDRGGAPSLGGNPGAAGVAVTATSTASGGSAPPSAGGFGPIGADGQGGERPSNGGQSTAGAGGPGDAGAAFGGAAQAGAGSSGAQAGAGNPGDPLPPYVPEGYELAYEQSFSEPASFDDLLIANEAEWFHSPEGFVEFTAATYAPPFRSPFSLALVKGVSASSFVLEVEMLQTGVGLGHRDMVIAWHVVSPSEFYYAHVSAEHDDVAHHIHIVNNADRAAITETFTAGFDWGTDVWRTLRVVRDAATGTMDVYDVDNDVLILSATDTTFTAGYFGVGSFDNTGRVRNLRIWSPDAALVEIPFGF